MLVVAVGVPSTLSLNLKPPVTRDLIWSDELEHLVSGQAPAFRTALALVPTSALRLASDWSGVVIFPRKRVNRFIEDGSFSLHEGTQLLMDRLRCSQSFQTILGNEHGSGPPRPRGGTSRRG